MKYGSTKLALNGWYCVVGGSEEIEMNYSISSKKKKKNGERDLDEGQALNVDVTEQSRIIETLFKVARLR